MIWKVPPMAGQVVQLTNDERYTDTSDYRRYAQEQSMGDYGIITRVSNSELNQSRKSFFENGVTDNHFYRRFVQADRSGAYMPSVEVQWQNGHYNTYSLKFLMPVEHQFVNFFKANNRAPYTTEESKIRIETDMVNGAQYRFNEVKPIDELQEAIDAIKDVAYRIPERRERRDEIVTRITEVLSTAELIDVDEFFAKANGQDAKKKVNSATSESDDVLGDGGFDERFSHVGFAQPHFYGEGVVRRVTELTGLFEDDTNHGELEERTAYYHPDGSEVRYLTRYEHFPYEMEGWRTTPPDNWIERELTEEEFRQHTMSPEPMGVSPATQVRFDDARRVMRQVADENEQFRLGRNTGFNMTYSEFMAHDQRARENQEQIQRMRDMATGEAFNEEPRATLIRRAVRPTTNPAYRRRDETFDEWVGRIVTEEIEINDEIYVHAQNLTMEDVD